MGKPLISIIIPVYNGSDYLKEAIDSALAQTYRNCEVIVINDGSCDNGRTEEIAFSYGDRIRYFSKANGGVAQALNYGIKEMKGSYFSWLSHDDVLYPEKVEKEFAELERTGAALVFCSYHLFGNGGRRSLVRLSDHFSKNRLEQGVFPVLNGLIQFGGVLFSKEIFNRYGVFNEELRTTQDFEFLFRVLKREKSCYLDEPLYGIRYHKGQGSRTIKSVQKDADEMFMMFLNDISDKEREMAYGSVYNYYYRMYLNILPQTHLVRSLEQCRKKLKSFKEKGYAKKGCAEPRSTQARRCMESYLEKGKRIYIYGCGNYGRRLKRDLELRGFLVEGFIDGNSQMWGACIDGSFCIPLKKLIFNEHQILIIVAALVADEIVRELSRYETLEFITKKVIDEAGMDFPPEAEVVLKEN